MPNMCAKELYTFTGSLTHLGNVRLGEQMICLSWTSWVDGSQTEETGSKCPEASNSLRVPRTSTHLFLGLKVVHVSKEIFEDTLCSPLTGHT